MRRTSLSKARSIIYCLTGGRHWNEQFPKCRVAERMHKNLSNRPRCCDNPVKALSLAKHRNPEYANTRSFL